MTMTRQHFALIASAIQEEGEAFERGVILTPQMAIECIALNLATKLRATNPSFNRDRFLRACGVEG